MNHLLVSASPLFLIGLESVINRQDPGATIYSAQGPEEAIQLWSRWSVTYLWWSHPLSFQKLMTKVVIPAKSVHLHIKILFLQHNHSPSEIRELFNKGISGYLGPNCSVEEIIEAFQSCKNNFTYIDSRTTRDLSSFYLRSAQSRGIQADQITYREKQVLQLIVNGHTTREIAAHLYISKCTVETHRLHLIRKIGVKNTAGLVREAVKLRLCDLPVDQR